VSGAGSGRGRVGARVRRRRRAVRAFRERVPRGGRRGHLRVHERQHVGGRVRREPPLPAVLHDRPTDHGERSTMTTMKSSDGSQYVLVLTKEQAELLGTLRHSHVAGGTQLYSALDGLPDVAGANFLLTYDPNNGKPIFGVLSRAPERRPQLADLLKDEATLRKERNTGWIVQYDRGHLLPFWVSLVGNGDVANCVYDSRNEAYRQMRNRAGEAGEPLDRYRVVPDGTKDGPERDRGYYVVE